VKNELELKGKHQVSAEKSVFGSA